MLLKKQNSRVLIEEEESRRTRKIEKRDFNLDWEELNEEVACLFDLISAILLVGGSSSF